MKYSILTVALLITSFFILVIVQRNNDSRILNNETVKVYNKGYNCIVIKKETDYNNHGQLRIILYDLISKESITFLPSCIRPANILYYRVNVGDTLTKENKHNVFYIKNGIDIDTFSFYFAK